MPQRTFLLPIFHRYFFHFILVSSSVASPQQPFLFCQHLAGFFGGKTSFVLRSKSRVIKLVSRCEHVCLDCFVSLQCVFFLAFWQVILIKWSYIFVFPSLRVCLYLKVMWIWRLKGEKCWKSYHLFSWSEMWCHIYGATNTSAPTKTSSFEEDSPNSLFSDCLTCFWSDKPKKWSRAFVLEKINWHTTPFQMIIPKTK